MTPEQIIFIILVAWLLVVICGLIKMVIWAARWGNSQAKVLENEFGTDVLAAFRYQFGLPDRGGEKSDVDG
jgi:hypothetical protein